MYKLRLFFLLLILLLPAACGVYETTTPVPNDESQDWIRKNAALDVLVHNRNIDLVFLGDSITERWEVDGEEVWGQYYGERKAVNLGISGDMIQNVLWRIENGNIDGIDPKLIVLLIGANNLEYSSYAIAAGVIKIVKTLRSMKPQTKILLLGIFPRGQDHNNFVRFKIIASNLLFKGIADGKNVVYLDIGNVFLDDSGDISSDVMHDDYVHLTAAGYQLWADAIEPYVQEMMDE